MAEEKFQGYIQSEMPTYPKTVLSEPADPGLPGGVPKVLDDNSANKSHTRMPQEHVDKLNKTKHAPNDTPTIF